TAAARSRPAYPRRPQARRTAVGCTTASPCQRSLEATRRAAKGCRARMRVASTPDYPDAPNTAMGKRCAIARILIQLYAEGKLESPGRPLAQADRPCAGGRGPLLSYRAGR